LNGCSAGIGTSSHDVRPCSRVHAAHAGRGRVAWAPVFSACSAEYASPAQLNRDESHPALCTFPAFVWRAINQIGTERHHPFSIAHEAVSLLIPGMADPGPNTS
jgi:hypothetical protein